MRELWRVTSGGGGVGGICGERRRVGEVWEGAVGRDVGWGRCGRELWGETSGGGGVGGRYEREAWEGSTRRQDGRKTEKKRMSGKGDVSSIPQSPHPPALHPNVAQHYPLNLYISIVLSAVKAHFVLHDHSFTTFKMKSESCS